MTNLPRRSFLRLGAGGLDAQVRGDGEFPARETAGGVLVGVVVHAGIEIVVGKILLDGQPLLTQVADALRGLRLLTGLPQRGEQDGGEDRDDRDHDQEFDQGERFFHGYILSLW